MSVNGAGRRTDLKPVHKSLVEMSYKEEREEVSMGINHLTVKPANLEEVEDILSPTYD
ncbi:MAG: hypothetical protein ABEI07_02710 [Candidatus Nanohaloarchaea archaeon]